MRSVILSASTQAGFLVAALSLSAGCLSDKGSPYFNSTGFDLATPSDMASGRRDLSSHFDLSAGHDLSTGPDLSQPMCNPLSQSTCGANEKCTFVGSETSATCVPDGTKTIGQSCGSSGGDDCIHSTICTADSGGTACRSFCGSDTDCTAPAAPAGSTAEPNNVAHCTVSIGPSNVAVCTLPCNPVLAAGVSGCASGLGCQAFATTNVAEGTDCGGVGAGADGTSCTLNSNCIGGFGCVANSATTIKTCRRFCRAGNTADCAGVAGYQCLPVTGWTMFGVCCPAAGC